jgi:uracil-DNA glycosylase family 4
MSRWRQKIFDCDICGIKQKKADDIGNIDSKVLIVAQNPAPVLDNVENKDIVPFNFYAKKEEKKRGEIILNNMVEELGLTINDFYLANVVKCCVAKVERKYIENCTKQFLIDEIKAMKNLKVIFCLGNISKEAILEVIEELKIKPKLCFLRHPGFIVRNGYNQKMLNEFYCKAKKFKEFI